MQEAIDSAEFSEWQFAESRGELPDEYLLFGMVTAAVMNSGFRHPKNPVGPDDFRPKLVKSVSDREKGIELGERLTKTATLTNDLTWNT